MENVKEKLAEARAKVIAYQQARKAVSPLAHLAEAELRAKVLASMTPKVNFIPPLARLGSYC